MATKTLIFYKADCFNAHGWEDRLLMPSGGLTDTLAEEIDFSGKLPALGQRVREYLQDEDTGHVTHGKDGNWIVNRIEQFSSFDTDTRIVLAWCSYQAVESQWQQLGRGRPVHELMDTQLQPSP